MRKSEIFLKRAIKLEKTTFEGRDSNLVWKMGVEPLHHYDSTYEVKYLCATRS